MPKHARQKASLFGRKAIVGCLSISLASAFIAVPTMQGQWVSSAAFGSSTTSTSSVSVGDENSGNASAPRINDGTVVTTYKDSSSTSLTYAEAYDKVKANQEVVIERAVSLPILMPTEIDTVFNVSNAIRYILVNPGFVTNSGVKASAYTVSTTYDGQKAIDDLSASDTMLDKFNNWSSLNRAHTMLTDTENVVKEGSVRLVQGKWVTDGSYTAVLGAAATSGSPTSHPAQDNLIAKTKLTFTYTLKFDVDNLDKFTKAVGEGLQGTFHLGRIPSSESNHSNPFSEKKTYDVTDYSYSVTINPVNESLIPAGVKDLINIYNYLQDKPFFESLKGQNLFKSATWLNTLNTWSLALNAGEMQDSWTDENVTNTWTQLIQSFKALNSNQYFGSSFSNLTNASDNGNSRFDLAAYVESPFEDLNANESTTNYYQKFVAAYKDADTRYSSLTNLNSAYGAKISVDTTYAGSALSTDSKLLPLYQTVEGTDDAEYKAYDAVEKYTDDSLKSYLSGSDTSATNPWSSVDNLNNNATSAQNFLKKFADKSGNKSGDYTATYTPESLLMTWEKNTIGENNGAVKYPGLDKDLKLTAKGTNEKITSASVSTLIANYNSNLKTAVDQAISIAGQNDPAVSNDDKVAAYKDALDKIKADLNTDGTGKSGLTEINGALKSDAERVIATLNGVNSAAKTLKESFDPNSTANASLISTVQPGSDYATKYGALVPITDALTTDNLSSKLGDYVSMVGKYVSLASAASTLAGEIKTQTEVLNTTAQNSILDLVGKVRDEDKNNVSGYDAAVTAVRTANSNASTAKDSTELSTLASAYNSLNSAINSLAAPMRAVLNNLVAAYDKTKQDAVKKVYNAANNQGLQDAFDTAFETAHNSAANEKTSAADALTAYTQLREAYDYLSLGSVGAARKKLQDLYGSTDTNSGDYNNSTDDAKSTFVSARNAAGDLLDGDTGETPKYTLGEYSEAYDTLSQAITRLTSAAKDRLQAQYNQRTTIKQSKRYLNSTNENKAAYDKAVDAAKAALDRQNTTAEDYTNAYKALVNAENNLRDETLSNLRASIEQYIRDNTGYANSKNIPNTTSQALLDQAEKAGTVDELNAIKDNATALINMVEFARNTLSHADETKATTNYSSDTAERRQAVDNAQAALQDYLKDDNSAAVTTTEVRAKALTLLQALNALAGDRAYQTALTQLADEMRQYSNTVYSSKYQNDSQERRSAYRTAYLKAKALYEDVTQNNKTATADEVNTLYQNLYTARMALAGLSDLDAAKQRLQTAILVNSVTNSNLNDKQKQAFQQALDKVKNDGDLRALENTVITIAREQNLLKDAIGDQSTVEDSSKYEHASQESKDAYNQALKESQDLLNNKSDVDTWSDVAAKRADLNAKQQALNGVSPYAAELQGLIDQSYDTTVDLKYTGADVTKRTNYLIAVAKGRFTLADPASKDTDYQASIDAIKSSAKVLDGDLPRKIVLFGAGGSALIVLLGYLISMLLKNQKSEQ